MWPIIKKKYIYTYIFYNLYSLQVQFNLNAYLEYRFYTLFLKAEAKFAAGFFASGGVIFFSGISCEVA